MSYIPMFIGTVLNSLSEKISKICPILLINKILAELNHKYSRYWSYFASKSETGIVMHRML